MKNLQLSLKKKWFEMTKEGIKTEDYRSITPYWFKRLMCFDLEDSDLITEHDIEEAVRILSDGDFNVLNEMYIDFKSFDINTMTLGYPKSTDADHILKLEHKGIEIRTENPEWGAEEGKLYFVIKHGKIL